MSALRWHEDGPPHRRPARRRGDLVPLSDQHTPAQQWFLGADGRTAHLLAPPATTSPGVHRRDAPAPRHERSLCAVFVTQVPAGEHAEPCPACLQLRSPPDPGICSIIT